MSYDYLIVLDFEATCWDNSSEHEIIEFPSVVIDIKNRTILDDRIEQFVKPSGTPKLSQFCKNLTSITQEQVNGGMTLSQALKNHAQFVAKYPNSLLVTAGDWDLKTMLPMDCKYNNLSIPTYYKRWANVKHPYKHLYKSTKKTSMVSMLNDLNIPLEGTHHRGIDDCYNIAKICVRMLNDGWIPESTFVLK